MDPQLKASDDREEDRVQFSYFTRFEEYQKHSTRFLEVVEDPEHNDEAFDLFRRIGMIVTGYQEQSYLLDPFLERMLIPPLQKFKDRARRMVEGKATYDGKMWQGLPALIYHLIKTRGAKTAVRFFPHTTEDLEVALAYLSTQDATASANWETRYIVLLWLSLVAMLPFDLAQFDRGNPGSTFERLEAAGKTNLDKAGLEREGAALLLTRLYARKDCEGKLTSFTSWAMARLEESDDPFRAIGTLHMLSETTKSGSGLKEADLTPMHSLLEAVKSNTILTSNTLVRKWATKLEGRLGLCELPPPRARQAQGRHLQPTTGQPQGHGAHSEVDFDVPDRIENTIENLLTALQDRDTVVRWSAAKGLARVAERLPEGYASQILETVIGLFSIHAFDGAGGVQDLPPASEATWHGATLACAEIARRGLVDDEQLPELIDWLKRGLYFDIRKGAHSIGSNVRDAVCYVLWAMARAQGKESFRPFSLEMARRLVTVSVFDREVHVRRAASAAFQEHVGRMSLFPHGIDIIRKTDFFAVGARRSAFTLAAPQVAEHEEYRDFLVNHLLTVSLKHWDPSLRQPGAVALRKICEEDLFTLGPACAAKVAVFLRSIDSNEVHGGLLALAEIGHAYKQSKAPSAEAHRLKVFEYIVNTPPSVFSRYKNDLILEAACIGLANTLSKDALALTTTKTSWRDIVMAGIKHRVEGADLWHGYTWVTEYPNAVPPIQQSTARILGILAYQTFQHGAVTAINCLLQAVDPKSKFFSPKVEPRQAAYEALPKILIELKPSLPGVVSPQLFRQIYETLIGGLLDYTADQRGDVGSWIRMACIRGLVDITLLSFDLTEKLQPLEEWMPPTLFDKAVSGTLKQAAERLDNVRLVAIEQIIRLIKSTNPGAGKHERWTIKGRDILQQELVDGADEMKTWADGSWLFPKLVRLLGEPAYMDDILLGFVLSIGSRGEGVTQPASSSFVRYANALPPSEVEILVRGILKIGQTNSASNNVFIPVLQTFDVLIEGGTIQILAASGSVDLVEKILSLASRNVDKIKSVPRLNDSAKVVIGLLSITPIAHKAVDALPPFLKHRFPKIRSATAEALYLALQGMDAEFDDEVEDALLQTTWTGNEADLQGPIDQVVDGLRLGLDGVSN